MRVGLSFPVSRRMRGWVSLGGGPIGLIFGLFGMCLFLLVMAVEGLVILVRIVIVIIVSIIETIQERRARKQEAVIREFERSES